MALIGGFAWDMVCFLSFVVTSIWTVVVLTQPHGVLEILIIDHQEASV